MAKRLLGCVAAAALIGSSALVPMTATADPEDNTAQDLTERAGALGLQVGDKATPQSLKSKGGKPSGPNPYLALLEDPSLADYTAWNAYLETQAGLREAERERLLNTLDGARPRPPVVVDEDEPDGTRGSNDSYLLAQPVPRFGTGPRDRPTARILGQLDNETVTAVAVAPNAEDDGSIPLAQATGVGSSQNGIATTGTIGDGPHGSSGSGSGDFDVYQVDGVAGEQLTADIDTQSGGLDSILLLVDATGEIIAANDDEEFGTLDSLLTYTYPDNGDYYVMVAGFLSLPDDPFDSSSGSGADSEGDYEISLTSVETDTDVYAVDLEVGDVLGLSVTGAATALGILDPAGTLVHGSTQDASFIYPEESPLPGGGNVANEHIVDEAGMHYIAVSGSSGTYDVTAEVYRPGIEGQPPAQTLFLDFDGARVNTGIFGGPGVRTLSPLRSFLGGWGLTNADYEPVARQVIATVTENVKRDLQRSGIDPDTRVRIRNSLDHRDTFGQENVSRIVIGGTIDESGLGTIGIAQSIDPGNYDQEETALVLLDVLSDQAPDNDASLNFYLTPRSDRIGFIGTAIGNVTSHEAGHFFGDWHVDQFNDTLNLMDQGGNFALLYGVGEDGVGGTADDPDVDFGEDEFNPNEGFTGIEDTLGRLAAVLVQ